MGMDEWRKPRVRASRVGAIKISLSIDHHRARPICSSPQRTSLHAPPLLPLTSPLQIHQRESPLPVLLEQVQEQEERQGQRLPRKTLPYGARQTASPHPRVRRHGDRQSRQSPFPLPQRSLISPQLPQSFPVRLASQIPTPPATDPDPQELEAVARDWTKPPPDAIFSLRVPTEFASLHASVRPSISPSLAPS